MADEVRCSSSGATRAEPAVSVVIPAYNAEGFIAETLDSVLSQTFQDYEVVVVDDGSVDDTRGVVESYDDARIRYVRQENGGASRARNRGIADSSGELVAFLDADDLWLPEKLERQVEVFRENPELGLLSTLHEAFSPETGESDTIGHRKRERLFSGPSVAHNIVAWSGLATPTVMVPRWVLNEVGLFDPQLRNGQDDNLWVRITARYPARLVDEVLVRCRMRAGSLSTNDLNMCRDVLTSLDQYMEDPEIAPMVQEAVTMRRARVLWDRGYHHFAKGDQRQARRSFLASVRIEPFKPARWIHLLLSLFPGAFMNALRAVRRR